MKEIYGIFLVIASPGRHYNMLKLILMKFMNSNPNFRTYFIYGKVNRKSIIKSKYDLYFNNIQENFIPGIFKKSIAAIKYINLRYNYKYIIRTNLSTFWRIDKLHSLLKTLPKTKFSGGYLYVSNNDGLHITGTGIIISKDICLLLSYFLKKNIVNINKPDDVLFTKILNKITKVKNCLKRNQDFTNKNIIIKFKKHKNKIKIQTNINDNYICYRLKTNSNRLLDYIKMTKLMVYFYRQLFNKNN